VIEKARKGDRVALGALETVGRNLGLGIASAATVCAPDIVVVGGGLSAAGRLLLAPAAAAFRAQALEFVAKGCRIVRAKTGNDAGLIGAALLAFEELEKASQPG
jgi:glucokinase